MILRLLNPQGIAGLAATICLGLLLLIQKAETHHWKKQSGQFEQLYHADQAAFAHLENASDLMGRNAQAVFVEMEFD